MVATALQNFFLPPLAFGHVPLHFGHGELHLDIGGLQALFEYIHTSRVKVVADSILANVFDLSREVDQLRVQRIGMPRAFNQIACRFIQLRKVGTPRTALGARLSIVYDRLGMRDALDDVGLSLTRAGLELDPSAKREWEQLVAGVDLGRLRATIEDGVESQPPIGYSSTSVKKWWQFWK